MPGYQLLGLNRLTTMMSGLAKNHVYIPFRVLFISLCFSVAVFIPLILLCRQLRESHLVIIPRFGCRFEQELDSQRSVHVAGTPGKAQASEKHRAVSSEHHQEAELMLLIG